MLTYIIVFAVVGAFAGAVGVYIRQRNKAQPKVLTTAQKEALLLEDERRILDLKDGDVVEIYGESFLIDGALLYDEEGSVWKTYLLGGADDGRDRWLSVDDDDRLEIGFYEVLPLGAVTIPAEPPASLTIGELTFDLQEKGTARVRKRDAKGTRDRGKCRYGDYRGPDRARLSVEWWGESPEVALGKAIDEDEILILPGS